MATSLKEKMEALDASRRLRIETRAAELVAEEMSLRDLRHARKLTQKRIAEILGTGQDGISKIEKRSDLLLSTLRSCLESMGGQLRLVVEFPDRPSVVISGFSDADEDSTQHQTDAAKPGGA